MSLSDLILSDVNDVILVTDDFAEVVTRYAGGLAASSSSVTAVVTWQPSQVDASRGKAYTQEGELLISSDVTVTESDAFVVGTRRCEVVSIDEPDLGMQVVRIKYNKPAEKGVRKVDDV